MPLLAGCSKSAATSASAPAAPSITGQSETAASPAAAPQSDRAAITAAIQAHLLDNKGINMAVMEMNLGKVRINGDQAQADAEFRLKQGGTSMLITYFLERHGNGWLVIRNEPSNAGQFAHPPMDKIHSGAPAATPNQDLPDFSQFLRKLPTPRPN